MTAQDAKGLEFDIVVIVEPAELIDAINADPKARSKTPMEQSERDLRGGIMTLAVALALASAAQDKPLPQRLVYVMGAEGEGMDRSLAELADAQISIPGTGNVESLNVANAAAVLLAASFGATE